MLDGTENLRRFHLRAPLFAGEIIQVSAGGCLVEEKDGGHKWRDFTPEMFDRDENVMAREGDFWVVFADAQEAIGPAETFIRHFVTHLAPEPISG